MTRAAIDKVKASTPLPQVQQSAACLSNSVQPTSDVQQLHESDGSKEKFVSRGTLLAELSNAILVYLACILKQDDKQSSPIIDDVVKPVNRKKDWDETRNQLDETFRSLSTWRRTVLHGRLQLIADSEATNTTSAIDVVMSTILIIAHQLTHLASLAGPWLAATDHVFRTVSETLQNRIENSQNEGSRAKEDCPICDKKDSEQNSKTTRLAYLERLKTLVSDLKEDAKPLQVVLSRLEKYNTQRAARSPELQHVRTGSRVSRKRLREEHTSTAERRGSSNEPKPTFPRNIAGLQERSTNSLPKNKEGTISEERDEGRDEETKRAKTRKFRGTMSTIENHI